MGLRDLIGNCVGTAMGMCSSSWCEIGRDSGHDQAITHSTTCFSTGCCRKVLDADCVA